MRAIDLVVIHCSASADGDASITRDWIDHEHIKRGWKKIGYHWVIHVDGSVHMGRPEAETGAHVFGHNLASIGVCMIGTKRFTTQQWTALRALVDQLLARYPGSLVKGHRDLSPDVDGDGVIEPLEWLKICPGFDVAKWLDRGVPPSGVIVPDAAPAVDTLA